jgi:hypothetical protein
MSDRSIAFCTIGLGSLLVMAGVKVYLGDWLGAAFNLAWVVGTLVVCYILESLA